VGKAKKKEAKQEKPQTDMRRFVLHRSVDASGVSGVGAVAEGCQFSNGTVCLVWVTHLQSMAYYQSLAVLEGVHGHGGQTQVVWVDEHEDKQ